MIFSALQDSVSTFVKFWNPSNFATSLHRSIDTFFRRARNEPGIEGQVEKKDKLTTSKRNKLNTLSRFQSHPFTPIQSKKYSGQCFPARSGKIISSVHRSSTCNIEKISGNHQNKNYQNKDKWRTSMSVHPDQKHSVQCTKSHDTATYQDGQGYPAFMTDVEMQL